jgi:hypothetical protein
MKKKISSQNSNLMIKYWFGYFEIELKRRYDVIEEIFLTLDKYVPRLGKERMNTSCNCH